MKKLFELDTLISHVIGLSDKDILRLINTKTCKFKQLVDLFKVLIDTSINSRPSFLSALLQNHELFEKLIKKDKLLKDDLIFY